MLKNIVGLHIIYSEMRDQVIAPPAYFFTLASKTFLGLKLALKPKTRNGVHGYISIPNSSH